MMSESFVDTPKTKPPQQPKVICIEKYFKIFFLSSISDPNDCSTMPFSMSNRHNATTEFQAGCPGAVSG